MSQQLPRWELDGVRGAVLSAEDSDPLDVEFASRVDLFDFAMEAVRDMRGVRLERTCVRT